MSCEKIRHPVTMQEKVFFVRAESLQMEELRVWNACFCVTVRVMR